MLKKYIVKRDYHNSRFDRWFKQIVLNIPQSLLEKLIRKKNLIEIPFEDFRSSPLKHVKRIYQKLNIEGYLNSEDSFKKYIDNQKSHKMNSYKIEKDLLKRIKNEFKQSLKEMNYSATPNNLNIIS